MTFYQVMALFLNGASHSSLLMWTRQFPKTSYDSLTDFFHKDLLPKIMLALVWHRFHPLTPGWLLIDEIILAKSKVGRCRGSKRRYKSTGGYVTPVTCSPWINPGFLGAPSHEGRRAPPPGCSNWRSSLGLLGYRSRHTHRYADGAVQTSKF